VPWVYFNKGAIKIPLPLPFCIKLHHFVLLLLYIYRDTVCGSWQLATKAFLYDKRNLSAWRKGHRGAIIQFQEPKCEARIGLTVTTTRCEVGARCEGRLSRNQITVVHESLLTANPSAGFDCGTTWYSRPNFERKFWHLSSSSFSQYA